MLMDVGIVRTLALGPLLLLLLSAGCCGCLIVVISYCVSMAVLGRGGSIPFCRLMGMDGRTFECAFES